jgi:hypothetical protein
MNAPYSKESHGRASKMQAEAFEAPQRRGGLIFSLRTVENMAHSIVNPNGTLISCQEYLHVVANSEIAY